jgi:hypothetical protein
MLLSEVFMTYTEGDKEIVLKEYEKVIEILKIDKTIFQFKINNTDNQLKIIELYRKVASKMEFDEEMMMHWLKTPNSHFLRDNNPTAPLDIIVTSEGLEEVIEYLDIFL